MKIAIIETGLVPPDIRHAYPPYTTMLAQLLKSADASILATSYSIVNDLGFPDTQAYDGVVLTGSPFGVYDDTPWMLPLMSFIRHCAKNAVPLVGICFGHQAIAYAYGAEVTKSPKGWGIGRHSYATQNLPDWLPAFPGQFSLAVSHQDQVITPSENAITLARSEFTNFAALYYPDAPALSFQGHPEFSDTYAEALYRARRGGKLSPEQVDAAVESLKIPHDNLFVGRWITAFFDYYKK